MSILLLKRLAMATAVVFFGSRSVYPYADPALMPPDLQRIIERGELIVAMHHDEGAPFYALNEQGELEGLDVELAESIAVALGVKVSFDRSSTTFDGLVEFVAAGKADLSISCVSRTPRRAMRTNFSTPYVRLNHAMLINRVRTQRFGSRPLAQTMNSPEIRIGTVAGSSYVDFAAKDYPQAEVLGFDDFNEAAAAAVRGDVHAVLFDNNHVTRWVRAHPEAVLYVQIRILHNKEDPIAIVVNWRDVQLLNWINTYLATLEGDGRLNTMREKWLGDNR